MPRLSICLPNLNGRKFLPERMNSILEQSFRDWELIVCDSYSDDGAWEFLEGFRNDARIRLHQVPREGIYAGWNECLSRAQGEYIYIATSDDTAKPDLIENMVGLLEKHPDVDLVVCGFEFIDERSKIMTPPPFTEVGAFYDPWRATPCRRSGWLEFLVHAGLDCPSWTSITSVVFRKKLVQKIGFFRSDCGTCADRLWAMRAAVMTDTISIPAKLATWRQHPCQASWGRPSIQAVRRNWELTAETLAACANKLPPSWMADPRWRERILRNVRGQYFKRIGLDRTTLKTKPREFMQGMAYASLYEPGYLVKRFLTRLSWRQDDFGNEEQCLRQLIQDWQVPWPPASL